MNLTDKAWETLFDRHDIVNKVHRNGYYEIKAKDIKVEREPRLMAKFDHSSNLPQPFKKNGFSILPNSRSSYIIGDFDVYEKVNYNPSIKPIPVNFPTEITTLDPTNLYSESSALHCAYASGMIQDILGESSVQTISGRMSSKEFDFDIRTRRGTNHSIKVKNSQVEIDGGYESQSQFMIVEAKNEMVEDFLVRQIYYPYRLWEPQTPKDIKPVFFTYSNDIFSFFVYEFKNPGIYNSIRLVEQRDYIIAHEEIEFDDIVDIMQRISITPEPAIPFPQADYFPRVVDLLGLLFNKDLSKDYITSNYDFDERQTAYYTSAAMYLNLVTKYINENKQVMFSLTAVGRRIMGYKTKEKYLGLAQMILIHEPFNAVLAEYFATGQPLKKERIVEIMKRCNLYNIDSESTYRRRASTVNGWVNWILGLPETY